MIDNKIQAIDSKINTIDNKIEANKKLIALKENQQVATKELIGKCDEEISIIKELIDIKKQQAVSTKKQIDVSEQLIGAINGRNDIAKQLIGVHNGQKGLMIEARDLSIEARDASIRVVEAYDKLIAANDKVIAANDKVIAANERVIAVTQQMLDIISNLQTTMPLYFAKYGGLPNTELQKQPEVKEVKSDITVAASVLVEQYPKAEHPALTQTVKNVVDATFTEIKPTDMKANRELFNNLGKLIEAALNKKHETLTAKNNDIREIMNTHYYKPLESFSRMSRLAYLDLAMKDIEA
jgi:hypothetical protein